MGIEIERKYLLTGLPPSMPPAVTHEIVQGYLPGRRLIERVRRDRVGGVETFTRTVKAGSGVSRVEIEEETTPEVFDHLWLLTEGRRVAKRRHAVLDGGRRWEIDEFLDRELVLVEIELDRADEAVELPRWLTPCVVREVTDDPAYLNVMLAR